MTYREKLELYSQGKLDEKERIEIEKELEKQEALADYLFEHQAPPGMDDFFGETSPFDVSGEDAEIPELKDDTETIAKQINSSIRKAFIKTGVIAAIAAIVLTLFVVFAMPHIVDAFYYDPGKIVGTDEDGNNIEQLELDMSVYSELTIPELGPNITAATESHGYGYYNYYINASANIGADDSRVVENVLNGNLKRNSFVCHEFDKLTKYNYYNGYLEFKSDELSETMNSIDLYYAYVSFDEIIPYEQFYADFADEDSYGTNGSWVWCGVQTASDDGKGYCCNEGFYARSNGDGFRIKLEGKAKPDLSWRTGVKELDSQSRAQKHFISMVEYLSEDNEFTELHNDLSPWVTGEEIDFVEKNGLNIYGFIYVGDKEHIETVAKAKGVRNVHVEKAL